MFPPRRFCDHLMGAVPVVAVVLLLGRPGVGLAAEAEKKSEPWPDRRTLDMLVKRFIDEPARERGIDDERRKFLRERGSKVIVGFVKRDRPAFEPLLKAVLEEAEQQEGWWPSPHVVHLAAEHFEVYLGRMYSFDEKQRELFGEPLEQSLSDFMARHRATLEPLASEVVLQAAGGEAPTTQQVADWSQRFLPVLRDFAKEWNKTARRMLPHLRPDQRKKWTRDAFRNKLSFTMGEAMLRGYARGDFDSRDWQSPIAGSITGPGNIVRSAKKRGLPTNPPPEGQDPAISAIGTSPGKGGAAARPQALTGHVGARLLPLDQWESYAKQFIARHRLDEGQKTAVMAVLKEVSEGAKSYRTSHAEEFAHLEKALGEARGDARARLTAEKSELERPLHDLFEQLRTRLDGVLTESQR